MIVNRGELIDVAADEILESAHCLYGVEQLQKTHSARLGRPSSGKDGWIEHIEVEREINRLVRKLVYCLG